MRLSDDARSVIDVPMWPTRDELLNELKQILDTTPPLMMSGRNDLFLDSRTGQYATRGYAAHVLHLHKRLDTIVKMLEHPTYGT